MLDSQAETDMVWGKAKRNNGGEKVLQLSMPSQTLNILQFSKKESSFAPACARTTLNTQKIELRYSTVPRARELIVACGCKNDLLLSHWKEQGQMGLTDHQS